MKDSVVPLSLPWPPSANRYWRHFGNRVLVSREALNYKKQICLLGLFWKRRCLTGRLSVLIQAFPPDKRVRDLDNLLKVTLDSLQSANFFENDSQIDKITLERMEQRKGGQLLVTIIEL